MFLGFSHFFQDFARWSQLVPWPVSRPPWLPGGSEQCHGRRLDSHAGPRRSGNLGSVQRGDQDARQGHGTRCTRNERGPGNPGNTAPSMGTSMGKSRKKRGLSGNRGTPQSSIKLLMGFSLINHPIGVPPFMEKNMGGDGKH